MDLKNDRSDVSKYFTWNLADDTVAGQLIAREGMPEAITYFAEHCGSLTDYGYWFMLGTLWVTYTGFSDLRLWKELFSAERRHREACIMKPSELRLYKMLPYYVTAYRAHRAGETDWISYTLDLDKAKQFANCRDVHEVKEYRIRKRDVLAYFTRRGENELLVLDKEKPEYIATHYVSGSYECEFCGNHFAGVHECGNTCCEDCCVACDAKYPDNPCKYRAEDLERREQAHRLAEMGSTQRTAALTVQELDAIHQAASDIAQGTAYTADEVEKRLKDFFRRQKAYGKS